MLGLYPFAPLRLLSIIRPRLPAWLPEVHTARPARGRARSTCASRARRTAAARHTVVDQVGRLTILDVPPPDAVDGDDGLLPRLLGWVLERAPGRHARALRIAMGDRGAVADPTESEGAGS